ncbi:ribonuclease H-like domain-containing protein [Dehalococcoidia bacterium]|nr:ribonuclease H-like domain-containing protein [Dehalococcoidia bacterium]
MISCSFIHLPGCNAEEEQRLWNIGIENWSTAYESNELDTTQRHAIEDSERALSLGDVLFFNELLKPKDRWRLLPNFIEETAFIDIETTGLGGDSHITMCGILDNEGYRPYIRGDNLDDLVTVLGEYKVIVTFNGISFDIPWIENELGFIDENFAHIDLRYVMKPLGFTGGLKKIEKKLGLDRGDDLSRLDGRDAIKLWNWSKRGDVQALETLIRYNAEDVSSLPRLSEIAYNKNAIGTPMMNSKFYFPTHFDTNILPYDSHLVDYLSY